MARLSREAQAGIDRLYRNWVRGLPKATVDEVRPAVRAVAIEISEMQARNAPVSQDERPGQLRDSHRVEFEEDGLRAVLLAGGEAAPHALHVELGTRKMAAESWFFPTWRLMKPHAVKALRKAWNKAIRRLKKSNG